jgi:small nuclear ribonucleoprotein (snRNP)-like protein
MTLNEFKSLKEFEGQRVRMTFTDGEEIVATLSSITTDFDESRHLVYDKVEQSTVARPHVNAAGAYYSPGEELISCVLESLD